MHRPRAPDPGAARKAIGNHLVRSWGRECADDDLELIGQLLARQPVEVMQRLARHFTPSALARQGLAERGMAIRALGEKRDRNKSHAVETTIRTPNPVRIKEASRQKGASKDGGRAQPGRERVSGVLFLAAS